MQRNTQPGRSGPAWPRVERGTADREPDLGALRITCLHDYESPDLQDTTPESHLNRCGGWERFVVEFFLIHSSGVWMTAQMPQEMRCPAITRAWSM